MKRGHRWGRISPGKRKTQEIQMRVNDVEVAKVFPNPCSICIIIGASRLKIPFIQTERVTAIDSRRAVVTESPLANRVTS